jgi:hypothetical protein
VRSPIPPGSCATGGGVDSDGDGLLDEWETNGVVSLGSFTNGVGTDNEQAGTLMHERATASICTTAAVTTPTTSRTT